MAKTEVYNIYSEFDIDKHKQTFGEYLEVIIDDDGRIMYAVPSLQEKLIEVACKKHNVSRDELLDSCPRGRWIDFLAWLCEKSRCCAVWPQFVYSHILTDAQIKSLQQLQEMNLYHGLILEDG